jgi:hypothetical protein
MNTEVVLAILVVISIIFLLFIYAKKHGFLPKYEGFMSFGTDNTTGVRGVGKDYFDKHILVKYNEKTL